jgi:hypothetical protein
MNSIQLVISNEVQEIVIKEYEGQRVVTLRDVDNLHRRPTGAARKTFNSHRKQFVENEDYFVLNTDEAQNTYGLKAPNGVILLTESGYLLLVKPFTDELAWTVQRQLIKTYFKAKEIITPSNVEVVPTAQQLPTTIEDILLLAIGNMKDMKNRVEDLEQKNQKLSLVVDNEIILIRHQKSEIQQAVDRRQGELNREGYNSVHFQGIYKTLKNHFDVPGYAEIKRSDFDKAMKIIAGWYPKKKDQEGA